MDGVRSLRYKVNIPSINGNDSKQTSPQKRSPNAQAQQRSPKKGCESALRSFLSVFVRTWRCDQDHIARMTRSFRLLTSPRNILLPTGSSSPAAACPQHHQQPQSISQSIDHTESAASYQRLPSNHALPESGLLHQVRHQAEPAP